MAGYDENVNQFDVARKRAAQQTNAAVEGQKDALKRRFAALGSVNSGAAIKQEQLADQAGAQQLQQANEGIDAAQNQEALRLKEIKSNQDFARSERLGSQDFSGMQADLQRKFQTGERLGSQDFANLQRLSSQDFAKGERIGGQDFAASQSALARQQQADQFNKQFDFSKAQYGDQQWHLEQQLNMAKQQFEMDKDTTAWNKMMAEKAADAGNQGILGSLFGDAFGKGGGKGFNYGSALKVGGLGSVAGPGGAVLGSVLGGGGGGGLF